MAFLAINRAAVDVFTNDRRYQIISYDRGLKLSKVITELSDLDDDLRIYFFKESNNIYLLGSQNKTYDLLVIDSDALSPLQSFCSEDALFVLQKLLRSALKYWYNNPFNRHEIIPQGSSKLIVFPFPFSSKSQFRFSIEREPNKKRSERRVNIGSNLLCYRSGYDEGAGSLEEPSLANYNKIVKALPVILDNISFVRDDILDGAVGVQRHYTMTTDIKHVPKQISSSMGYNYWINYLTSEQRIFVQDVFSCPHKIEGPAGTGKTLCLILKCMHNLLSAKNNNQIFNAAFIAHSEASKKMITHLFEQNDDIYVFLQDREYSPQSIEVTTLQQLCKKILSTEISESEFLDRDAMESKYVQLLYINDALEKSMAHDLESYKKIISTKLYSFMSKEDSWRLAEMLQHEFSVIIKGRAEDDLVRYVSIPFDESVIPIKSKEDREYIFSIFSAYQKMLQSTSQFDTDDIVISTSRQLNTPIWRRRKKSYGYDALYIDETHLFNVNELSVFHFLLKSSDKIRIAFSVDKSQAIGDRGWDKISIFNAISGGKGEENETSTAFDVIFRCSPDIIRLAESITTSGATLFSAFHNPLHNYKTTFTIEEEKKTLIPDYYLCKSDESMFDFSYALLQNDKSLLSISNNDVIFIVFDEYLYKNFCAYSAAHNKNFITLESRGDYEIVKKAQKQSSFIISLPDYVGGLEFESVILIGVDNSRVPPLSDKYTIDSDNFLRYISLNRLYVSVTRAKYRVHILGNISSGPCELLSHAIDNKLLTLKSESDNINK